MKTSTLDRTNGNNIRNLLKGVFVAVIISLAGILAFALVIKFFGVPQNVIQPINQVIKFLSILLGIRSMYKGNDKKSLIMAIIMGAVYTLTALLMFSLLSSSFRFEMSMLTDTIFGGIAGLISGIIIKILSK